MIHKFALKGFHVVLDVESGAVHLVDPLAFRLLDYLQPTLEEAPPATALAALTADYTPAQIAEAYGELRQLWQEGQLFAPEEYGVFRDKLGLAPVKAMCLNVSHDCNLRCAYCFAGKGDYSQGRKVMDAETGKAAIDYLVAHSGDRERLEVDFFGGEPLLGMDTVRAVIAYARSREGEWGKRFRFTITTNGMLLDDGTIDFINTEMENVVLSLDGRKEVTDRVRARVDGSGCYETIVPKFQRLVERRGEKEYYVRGTFTRYNKDFGEDVMALRALGFDQVSVEPVVAPREEPYALTEADLPEIFAEYERLVDRLVQTRERGEGLNFFHFMLDLEQGPCAIKRLRGCGCGNEYVAVTPDGEVYPCHQFIGLEDWRMGSVHQKDIDLEIKGFFAGTSVLSKADCRDCWAKFYCSGGCSANNLRYAGGVEQAHTLSCEMEKKRLECAIVLKALLLERETAAV